MQSALGSFICRVTGMYFAAAVTKHIYLETLKTHLPLPTIINDGSIFMSNDARIHKVDIIQEWFYEEAVDVVTWPPCSLDLKPLENLWNWKMLKAESIRPHPERLTMEDKNATKAHLLECAQEGWVVSEEELCSKLASGMQERVDAVKAANGRHAK